MFGLLIYLILQFSVYRYFGFYGGIQLYSDLKSCGITISSGLFTGALVTLLVTWKEYFTERKEALEAFYYEVVDIEKATGGIKYFTPDEPYELIENLLKERQTNAIYRELIKQYKKQHMPCDEIKKLITHEAELKFQEFLWENMPSNEKILFEKKSSKEKLLKRKCDEKCKDYKEKIESAMRSYLLFDGVSTRNLNQAYKRMDFFFANKSIKERICDGILQNEIEMVSDIKWENIDFKYYFDVNDGNLSVMFNKIMKLQEKLISKENNNYYRQHNYEVSVEIEQLLKYVNGKMYKVNKVEIEQFLFRSVVKH